ncbi:MAG: dihydrolipoyl dehydrogenase [Syntrophobacteraceae bacterium]|nr:dihydrolipoyl dehydrogenase [Desulfobacteraceae bacterium]
MAGMERYDLAIIGGGPGGCAAAVRAARLGLKTACIDRSARLGGVCLNVGCIPSKVLLDSSEAYRFAAERLGDFGIRAGSPAMDLDALMARKDRIVRNLGDGVRRLLEGHKVSILRGTARIAGANRVEVTSTEDGEDARPGRTLLEARAILLATGSEPVAVPGLPFNGTRIVSSTEVLAFDSVPRHLGVLGGGYIGLELGSAWLRLGARVTVVEMMPRIVSMLDGQVARALERSLVKQGFVFRVGARVASATVDDGGVRLRLVAGEGEEEISCDRLLVAAGRRPLTAGLGLEAAGVFVDPRSGRVPVDECYRTNVPGIYAIGDLVAGPMLAHKASAEGAAAVECIAGLPGEVNYDTIPSVIFTSPEVASVGLSEEQVRERGVSCSVGVYPFSGVARALSMGGAEGFAKIVAGARSGRILGVHIIGPHASDLIAECVVAMEYGATAADVARIVHAHPTLPEVLHEAADALKPV